MNMKRAIVDFAFEGRLEFEVPCGASEAMIEKLARKAVLANLHSRHPDAGELSLLNVIAVENDGG